MEDPEEQLYFVLDEVKAEVLQAYHDSPLAGHPGSTKTVGLVQREYWWPTIFGDVRSYVRGCDRCQRTKALRQTRARVLHPNEVPEGPWQIVTVDLIGELPESNGYNAICVLVDRFSKQMHAVPTTTKLTAEGMAKIYRDHVFRLHGLPRKIIHDRGTQFDAKMMKELYKLLHIEGNPSTAYHPQTDGQTERVNQELEQYLRMYINHHHGLTGSPWPSSHTTTGLTQQWEHHHSMSLQGFTQIGGQQSPHKEQMNRQWTLSGEWRGSGRMPVQSWRGQGQS